MGLNPRGETDKFNTLAVSKQGEGYGVRGDGYGVRGEGLEVAVKDQQMCEESAPSEFESTCSRKYLKIYSY